MLSKWEMMELLSDLLRDAVDDQNENSIATLSSSIFELVEDTTDATLNELNEVHGGCA